MEEEIPKSLEFCILTEDFQKSRNDYEKANLLLGRCKTTKREVANFLKINYSTFKTNLRKFREGKEVKPKGRPRLFGTAQLQDGKTLLATAQTERIPVPPAKLKEMVFLFFQSLIKFLSLFFQYLLYNYVNQIFYFFFVFIAAHATLDEKE